jgi:hypothetical protein
MTRSTTTPWRAKKASAGEEGAGTLLRLVGQDLGVGEAGGIVDADMDQVPADALLLAAAIAGDAMADAIDPAELLGVDCG